MSDIFVTRPLPGKGLDQLQKAGFSLEIYTPARAFPKRILVHHLQTARAIICLSGDHIDRALLAHAGKQLKIIATCGVGYDHIDVRAAAKAGILVTNTPDISSIAVAEHAMMLMLSLARRVRFSDQFVRAGRYRGFKPLSLLTNEVYGKTLGIIGFGHIGKALTKIANDGFRMKVIYFDIQRSQVWEKKGVRYCTLTALLRKSDFVSLHAPMTKATHHMIGAHALRMMKKSAYLINTARGALVDEQALVKALRSGTIAGVALDVFENEPHLTPGLTRLQRVLFTPHIASFTHETRCRMVEIVAEDVLAALRGRKPKHLVDGFSLNKSSRP